MKVKINEFGIVAGACVVGICIGSYIQQKRDIRVFKKVTKELSKDVINELDKIFKDPIGKPANVDDAVCCAVERLKKEKNPAPTEIIFDTLADAEKVLNQLLSLIENYGHASLLDLYDLIGHYNCFNPFNFRDDKRGWKSLFGVEINKVKKGYAIVFPKLVELKGE